jgi:enoyl-[acyl-carrier protein] reductase I
MSDKGTPLKGKTALVLGVASEESIAWAIALELAARGANIVIGYQFRYHSRIKDLAPTCPNLLGFHRCDIMKDDELDKFFQEDAAKKIDIVVHAIAFAPGTAFQGRVVETSQDDFSLAMQISAHSLTKVMNKARAHMPDGGSVIALSYLGGVRVCQNYKLMGVAKAALEAYVRELSADLGPEGIRVNAISAGPIKTLAASGIPDFEVMLEYNKSVAPMRENVTQQDVANCAAFLGSDDSTMITGQTIYVDAGYSVIGVPNLG